jgi:nicotinate-nucleotide--dimethylbenzimidazole phosphoribosyltransferase
VIVPDSAMAQAARAQAETDALTQGSLGKLSELSIWGAGVQRRFPTAPFAHPALIAFVVPNSAIAQQHAHNLKNGIGLVAELARAHSVRVKIIEASEDVTDSLALGRATADNEIDAGTDLLIPLLVNDESDLTAAAVIGLFTRSDAAAVTSSSDTQSDAEWMDRCASVRDAMRAGRPAMGEPLEVLESVGAGPLAALVGVLLQSTERATPAMIDGRDSSAAALVAQRITRSATQWWITATTSADRAVVRGLDHLEIPVVTDLNIHSNTGVGALAALPVLQVAMTTLCVESIPSESIPSEQIPSE